MRRSFFAVALGNALYWLAKFDRTFKENHPQIDAYLNSMAAGKDLRDMLEHDGDYIAGIGRKQSDYLKSVVANNGQLSISGLHPFTLLRTNEGLSLGGRIDIAQALELSRELLRTIYKS